MTFLTQIMTFYTICILLFFANISEQCSEIKIGFLLSSSSAYPGFPTTQSSGKAVTLAMQEVRRRHSNINITIEWRETGTGQNCEEVLSILVAYELSNQTDVIIGPACAKSMDLVTRMHNALSPSKLPPFTWLPRQQVKSYPNGSTISTYGTFSEISDSLFNILNSMKWKSIGIISSNDELCISFIETVNDQFPNKDIDIRRYMKLDHLSNQTISDALHVLDDHARIIIVCMPPANLRQLLILADSMSMQSRGFVFLYCRFGPSANAGLIPEINLVDRSRILGPLLQFGVLQDNTSIYDNFLTQINSNSTISHLSGCCKPPDEFTSSLYDTILFVTEMYIDMNCSVTTPLSMPPNATTLFGVQNIGPDGKILRPVKMYHYQHGVNVHVTHDTIHWQGKVPTYIPRCGWTGTDCSPTDADDNHSAAIIGSCVGTAALLLVAVIIYIVYRKSKIDKQLLDMIWKVNRNDVKMRRPRANTANSLTDKTNQIHPKKKLIRAETRGTLCLGSTSSIDKTLLFAPVGSYRGSIVAVKNIQRRSINLTNDAFKDLKALRDLQHENLNPFIGINLEPGNSYVLSKYCAKGSLQDVLENDDIKLDSMFTMSFLMDLARGLDFLHKSLVKSHGNLKSTNCVIDSRWVLKLTDYGSINSPNEQGDTGSTEAEHEFYSKLLWTAPELLRMQKRPPKGTQKGDVYSFAIIMSEILLRCPPYYFNNVVSSKVIVNRLRNYEDPPYRPRLPEDQDVPEKLVSIMTCCWVDNPETRPDMHTILKRLIDVNGRKKINIMDNMISMLEAYSNNLEELVANRTEQLAQEKQKTDRLLYQMLPPSVVEQLKIGEHVVPETYNEGSLFFSDIVGFTSISSNSTPLQVIDLLNDLYTTFDEIIGMHDVYKVETIGDAYMVASGIPRRNGKRHTGEIANMALDLLSAVTSFRIRHMTGAKLQLRIGLHNGPCAAGVVGLTMPRYCLFGDTVNMASRMESTGKAFHIHVSSDMFEGLTDLNWGFNLLERGLIEVKGKGLQKTYWLIGKDGFKSTLPEEIQILQKKYTDAMDKGRPLSPTDTHISNSSTHDSTSMYGNAFRRASIAMTFLRRVSHSSIENSPNGSRLTVKDYDSSMDQNKIISNNNINNLNAPDEKPNYGHKLPGAELDDVFADDNDKTTTMSSAHKKKKKKKKKRKNHDNDNEEKRNSLQIPTIEITPQY